MSKKVLFKVFTCVIAIAMLVGMAPFNVEANHPAQLAIQVDQAVFTEIQEKGIASYYVQFQNTADLSLAHTMSWEDRGWFVYNTLHAQAEKSQSAAMAYLSNAGIEHTSFWINNTLFVTGSDATILSGVQTFEGVEAIFAEKEYQLYLPEQSTAADNGTHAVEGNLVRIKAPEAWALGYTGKGLTVGSIDTGGHFTHETLNPRYRGKNSDGTYDHNYNWLDPYTSHYPAPQDDGGHGSHTIGTMVGSDGAENQIGVAPGAKWMACRGCDTNTCAGAQLTACAQFMTAPHKLDGTEPNPSLRPVVVNNSWGDCDRTYDDWFSGVVDAWIAAGVYPVFSNGNASNCNYGSNPGLGTVGNPARYGNVSGVGSTGKTNGEYALHSNKGPTDNLDIINPRDGRDDMKPQFVAPGVGIRSSFNTSDSSYNSLTGTSMSAPHVSGLVALIVEAGPCLRDNYAMIESLIEATATEIAYAYPPGTDPLYPNYGTGWGEIDALAAVQAAAASCGSSTIQGTVKSDIAGNPVVAGVKIVATADGEIERTVNTDENGHYTLQVNPGTWTLTASKRGFEDAVSEATAVAEGETVTVDLTMHEQPNLKLSGTVYDGGVDADNVHGYPLYAKVTVVGDDATEMLYTDPFTGKYETSIYPGKDYTITVQAIAKGYDVASETINVTAATVQDFDLSVNVVCQAPGYRPDYSHFYDFESSDHGFVAGGTRSSWAWGEFTSGLGRAVSGTKGIATNPAGDYNPMESSWMMSPEIDLSGNQTTVIEYWAYLYVEAANTTRDVGTFQASKDGGRTWVNIWGPLSRQDSDYVRHQFFLDSSFSVPNFKMRFQFRSNATQHRSGWYIDDIGIASITLPPPVEIAAYHFDDESEAAWEAGFLVGDNEWQHGVPTTGPGAAHSGEKLWATNLTGNYSDNRTSYFQSPVLDLSEYAGSDLEVTWWDWMVVENRLNNWDYGTLWASGDGGETFSQIGATIRTIDAGTDFKYYERTIPASFVTDQFQLRFQFRSDTSTNRLGWYVDDVTLSAKPALSEVHLPCVIVDGGLVTGYVLDKNFENQDHRLIGAKVVAPSAVQWTAERPNDPEHNGLYSLFQPFLDIEEYIDFTVSMPQYKTETFNREIEASEVNRQDFAIGAAILTTQPTAVERTITLHDDDEIGELDIVNIGTGDASFALSEIPRGFKPLADDTTRATVNIPAISDEKVQSSEQPSLASAPVNTEVEASSKLEFQANLELFGIFKAPAAVGSENITSKKYRWSDVSDPMTFQDLGWTNPIKDLYAGDFLGDDYENWYVIMDENDAFYKLGRTSSLIGHLPLPRGQKMSGLTGATGYFYAVSSNCGVSSMLHRIDLDGTLTEIGEIVGAPCMADLAYVPEEHMLYGVDISTDYLHKIDPESGDQVPVGYLGADANYGQGMDYDEDNGVLYWAAYADGTHHLRIIDMKTGASQFIGNFPPARHIDAFSIETHSGGADLVPWLTETPEEAFVAEGESQHIALRFSVKGIEQPGDYYAELRFTNDSPYEMDPVPVTLHVVRPYSWGNFKGVVTAHEKCDASSGPAVRAKVHFYKDGELFKTARTNANGEYSYALEAGTYDIEIEHAGYVGTRIDGVELIENKNIVVNFDVNHDSACLTYTPESLMSEQMPGFITTQNLTFSNTGTRQTYFEIIEGSGDADETGDPLTFQYDDGMPEGTVGLDGTHQYMWLTRFTPEANMFPLTITHVELYWAAQGGVAVGDMVDIYLYENRTSQQDPAEGSTFLYKETVRIGAVDTFETYVLTEPVVFEGPGDLMVGVGAITTPGSTYHASALDISSSAGRSFIGWWSTEIPEEPTLPPNEAWFLIDEQQPGNWLIRAYGTTGISGIVPRDIEWLEEDPTAAVLDPGASEEVTVSFSSYDLTWGEYNANLIVRNQYDPRIVIPVQLRVLELNMLHLPLIQTYFPEN